MEWGYILSDHAIYLDLEGMPCSRGGGFVPFAGVVVGLFLPRFLMKKKKKNRIYLLHEIGVY